MSSGLLFQEPGTQSPISEMSKNIKGIDLEGVLEVYLRFKFDMFINVPSRGIK